MVVLRINCACENVRFYKDLQAAKDGNSDVMLLAGSYDHTCKIWDIRNKQVSLWHISLGSQIDENSETPRYSGTVMSMWLGLQEHALCGQCF